MINLYLHELRMHRRMLAILAVAVVAFAFLMAYLVPAMRASMVALVQSTPSFLRGFVKHRIGSRSAGGLVGTGYKHPVWITLMGIWGIGYGGRAIAGPIENGTLGLTLAYPLRRSAIVTAKVATLFTGLVILLGLSLVATSLGLWVHHEPMPGGWHGLMRLGLGALGLEAILASFSLAVSAISREAGRALGAALAFAVGSFFLDTIGQIWDAAKPYRPLSVFYYFEPGNLLLGTNPVDLSWWIFGLGTLAFVVASYWFLIRRDLPI